MEMFTTRIKGVHYTFSVNSIPQMLKIIKVSKMNFTCFSKGH